MTIRLEEEKLISQDDPLPPTYFAPSHFCKKRLLKRWKCFLFEKTLLLHYIFLIIKAEKIFSKDNTVWYAFYIKFVTFNDFEKKFKYFREIKPICFFQKTTNFERFEKPYCISRILRQMWYNLVKIISKRERNWLNWIWRTFTLSGRFRSHVMNKMAQINNDLKL